jgi:hypothetical protein
MATDGLSLVGFMSDPNQALLHLKTACVPEQGKSDADLLADWNTARSTLGHVNPRAGVPNLQPIPMNDPYIQQLMQAPWATGFGPLIAQGASFQMVELDPLLAFQFAVDTSRSASHCSPYASTATQDQLLAVCLPQTLSNDPIHVTGQGLPGLQSLIIKSRSLNLQIVAQGNLQLPDALGIQFGWGLPFVHVVRFNGRCYLHNGYHRAVGLRALGATEIPCMFRDVADAPSAGIQPPGTFDLQLLESASPPTIAHFSNGIAFAVRLRATMRIIQINWSQHTMVDE